LDVGINFILNCIVYTNLDINNSANSGFSPSVEVPILDGHFILGFINISEQNLLGEYFRSKWMYKYKQILILKSEF